MRRHLLAFAALAFMAAACDETPGVGVLQPPQLTDLQIAPGDVQFTRETDGVKDTTITFRLSVGFRGDTQPDQNPEYVLIDTDSNIAETPARFATFNEATRRYETSFSVATNTNLFRNFELVVFARNYEEELGNRIVRKLSLKGIPGTKPEIADATVTPARVTIPATGEVQVLFLAFVADADGLDNIGQAYMQLVSKVTGTPSAIFTLVRGNIVSGRAEYGIQIPVQSSAREDSYDVLFFADDKAGLRSDTLHRSLDIVR